jgi:hypothetical protein
MRWNRLLLLRRIWLAQSAAGYYLMPRGMVGFRMWARTRGYAEPVAFGVGKATLHVGALRLTPAGEDAMHRAEAEHARHGRMLPAWLVMP